MSCHPYFLLCSRPDNSARHCRRPPGPLGRSPRRKVLSRLQCAPPFDPGRGDFSLQSLCTFQTHYTAANLAKKQLPIMSSEHDFFTSSRHPSNPSRHTSKNQSTFRSCPTAPVLASHFPAVSRTPMYVPSLPHATPSRAPLIPLAPFAGNRPSRLLRPRRVLLPPLDPSSLLVHQPLTEIIAALPDQPKEKFYHPVTSPIGCARQTFYAANVVGLLTFVYKTAYEYLWQGCCLVAEGEVSIFGASGNSEN